MINVLSLARSAVKLSRETTTARDTKGFMQGDDDVKPICKAGSEGQSELKRLDPCGPSCSVLNMPQTLNGDLVDI
jgi:hypothetical protein